MIIEFLSIGIFTGFLVLAILILNVKLAPLTNKLLIGVILPLTLVQLMFYFYVTGFVLKIPYTYRWNSVLNFFIFPSAYLYVRTVISDRHIFKKRDYLHYLPVLLHFFQMLPFYLLPLKEKRAIVFDLLQNGDNIVQFRDGGLPPYVQFLVLAFQGLVYTFLMYRLVFTTYRGRTPRQLIQSGKQWLIVFTTLVFLIVLALVLSVAFPPPKGIPKIYWMIFTVMIVLPLMTSYLFFQPNVLYGLPQVRLAKLGINVFPADTVMDIPLYQSPDLVTQQHNPPEAQLSSNAALLVQMPMQLSELKGNQHNNFSHLNEYLPLIENHFKQNKPYLNKGFTITDLSAETGIPVHHLSALFNKVLGVRINDYINAHRLNFLEEIMSSSDFKDFTQEGLAWQAGFSSRISFFNAVKKLKNQTPAEFLSRGNQPDQGFST